jgi:hypothetical protein
LWIKISNYVYIPDCEQLLEQRCFFWHSATLLLLSERIVDAENERALSHSSCPKCGSHDVRRSKSEGFVAALWRIFGRWPYRCRSCRARYFRTADPPDDF